MTRADAFAAAVAASVTAAALPASAEAPLSAIDWLSESVNELWPQGAPDSPIVTGALAPDVSVAPLGTPDARTPGLQRATDAGLPAALWAGASAEDLGAAIGALGVPRLPGAQSLLFRLLTAEAAAPLGTARAREAFFLARVDRLLDIGAVDAALALLEAAGPDTPERLRRYFDAALLTGSEEDACTALAANPGLAPTYPARIFCLARAGDWQAAALALQSGAALGEIETDEAEVLARFLDPELFEGADPLPVPEVLTPLEFRLREAVGEGLPTAGLPRAFAAADLRPIVGWKAQLEAAERLARYGALPANRLLGAYTERTPAASGGVWDRAAAVSRLDTALSERNAAAVAEALPGAWAAARAARVEGPFAELFGEPLLALAQEGETRALALRIALLSPKRAEAALMIAEGAGRDAEDAFLAALAQGAIETAEPPDAQARAIAAALSEPRPEGAAAGQGRALLAALEDLERAINGDDAALARGLSALQGVGLGADATRLAIEMRLLDRRV
jgi:hypothetical protein